MSLIRLLEGWLLVLVWLGLWELAARRFRGERAAGRSTAWLPAGEALLLTLFGGLWFGSLGAGGWWLVFLLVGALREWPASPPPARGRLSRAAVGAGLLGVGRTLAAGGLLAWRLSAS